MAEKIRDLIDSHKSEINLGVSSDNRFFEDKLIEDSPFLLIPEIPQSYRRYGYGLLSYVSKKMVYDWFEDYQTVSLFPSIQSKITNSGMSAIDLTISTLASILNKRKIIAPTSIYFASDELLKMYEHNLLEDVIRYESKEGLERIIENSDMSDFILFLETCSNSPDMTFYSEKDIKKYSEKFNYVLVDGSLIGLSRVNPSIFDNRNVIYVESLSKNYHQEESSRVTAGIVIYPEQLEESFQKRFYCSGCYLQLNDLMELPVNLYEVGKERIMTIAKRVSQFYAESKEYTSKQSIHFAKISEDISKTPLVLFLDFQSNNRLDKYIRLSHMPKRGSFGHNSTYILPIGLMWKTAPKGLARIAFGTEKYDPQYIKAFGELEK